MAFDLSTAVPVDDAPKGKFDLSTAVEDAAPVTQSPTTPPAPPTLAVAKNAGYEGVSGLIDSVLNAPNEVLNMGRALVGGVMGEMGAKPENLPELVQNPDFARRIFEKIKLIDPSITPQGAQKALDVLIQGGIAGALTSGASIPRSLMGAGMGALASGAGTGTESVSKAMGASEPLAAALGNTAGLLAPKGAAAIAALPRMASTRNASIPPERVTAYRAMTEKGARPQGDALIYGEANKNISGQQRVANETYNESVGLPKKQDFGGSEIMQAKQNVKRDYETLLTGREVLFDKTFFDTMRDLYDHQSNLASTGVTFAEARPIIATLDRIANLPQGIKDRIAELKNVHPETTDTKETSRALAVLEDALKAGASGQWKMDAKDYNEVRSILGKDAQRSKSDTNRSGLLWKMQKAFDDAADRSMPDIAKPLSETRGKYENLMILSDAMVGKGAGHITPEEIGRKVAQREGHRSLEPNQKPLKELGQHGLSLSGDKAIDNLNLSGIAAHVPKGGVSMNALKRVLETPITAVRARAVASPTFNQKAQQRETEAKDVSKRSAIPTRAYDDAEKERKYQEWKARQEATQ